MGVAERMLERQLRRGKGTRQENLRNARWANGLLLLAAAFNGLAVLFGVTGKEGTVQTFWVVLGLFWLVFTYLLVRQRLYMTRLATDERVPIPSPAMSNHRMAAQQLRAVTLAFFSLALLGNLLEVVADPDGTWWTAVRAGLAVGFTVALIAWLALLLRSRLRKRRSE